ncbi:hypothetical protein [Neobacillus niacini]|nr:hypothetical protein [Neobacillus niacini]MCM3763612.1 hypothetical protein [Neobacillus niacini]
MAKGLWLTPEEVLQRKKRKKTIINGAILLGTVLLSTVVTILANSF